MHRIPPNETFSSLMEIMEKQAGRGFSPGLRRMLATAFQAGREYQTDYALELTETEFCAIDESLRNNEGPNCGH